MRGPGEAFEGWAALWPLAADVGFFRCPLAQVQDGLVSSGNASVASSYTSLDKALSNVFERGDHRHEWCWFLSQSPEDNWTMILSSSVPHTELTDYMAGRASRDVKSDYVSFGWMPQSPESIDEVDSAPVHAYFLDFERPRQWRWTSQRIAASDTRFIQVAEENGSWVFDASGPQKRYEDPDGYRARLKSERLPLTTIERYLAARSVPLDFSWSTAPTTVLTTGRSAKRPFDGPRDLRVRFGYPAAGVPDRLRR